MRIESIRKMDRKAQKVSLDHFWIKKKRETLFANGNPIIDFHQIYEYYMEFQSTDDLSTHDLPGLNPLCSSVMPVCSSILIFSIRPCSLPKEELILSPL